MIWWILICLFLGKTSSALAADISEVSVRLNRSQVGTSPLPLIIKIKTGNDDLENKLRITAADGYVLSNIAIDSDDFTLDKVENGQIFLNSLDLNKNNEYQIKITQGLSNNPLVVNEMLNKWKIATMNNSQVLGEKEVKATVVSNDQIVVTGKVGAKSDDFELEADKSVEEAIQNQEVGITINFKSNLNYTARPIKIEAEWSLGTIQGSPIPSVEVVNYLANSANSYRGAVPIIDLINRKITWNISSIEAGSDNNLYFKLKTNQNYTGANKVITDLKISMVAMETALLVDDLKINYSYYQNNEITPTSIPTSGQTTATATPTTVPVVKPIETTIKKIEIIGLDPKKMTVMVEGNQEVAGVKIKLGESIGKLNQSITSINGTSLQKIKFDNLKEGTDYYFVVEITGKNGEIVSSDIYTFSTPERNSGIGANKESVVVLSQEGIVSKDGLMVLPKDLPYTLKIDLKKVEGVKEVKLLVRKKDVLGINSVMAAEPNTVENEMSWIEGNGFECQLKSPKETGYYEVYLRIKDVLGNIVEEKVADLKVLEPVVVTAENGRPIEAAEILIYRFDQNKKIYQKIPSTFQGITNPVVTDFEGKVRIALPKGKYRFEISSLGYITKTVDFDLGIGENEGWPEMVLTAKKGVDLISFGKDYHNTISRLWRYNQSYWEETAKSEKVKRIIWTINWFCLGALIIELIAKKNKIEWWQIVGWYWPKKYLGRVVDEKTKKGIGGVKVAIFDDKNKIETVSYTDALGRFNFNLVDKKSYRLIIDSYKILDDRIRNYSRQAIEMGKIIIETELAKKQPIRLLRIEEILVSCLLLINFLVSLSIVVSVQTLRAGLLFMLSLAIFCLRMYIVKNESKI